MNQDKTDTASDSEQDSSQTREKQEKWLAVRRDRLAGERRRNLLIVASVGTVALLLVFFLVWKWRSSSTNSEETVAPVVSDHCPAGPGYGGRKDQCADQNNGVTEKSGREGGTGDRYA